MGKEITGFSSCLKRVVSGQSQTEQTFTTDGCQIIGIGHHFLMR